VGPDMGGVHVEGAHLDEKQEQGLTGRGGESGTFIFSGSLQSRLATPTHIIAENDR